MLNFRPYEIEAYRQWVEDSGFTPYMAVIAEGASVPMQYVKDGKIVLNVRTAAMINYRIGQEGISFTTRFGGQPFNVFVPTANILAVYGKENGEGVMYVDVNTANEKQPAILSAPIQDLPLSRTVATELNRRNIVLVSDLLAYTRTQMYDMLKAVDPCGDAQVNDMLVSHGLQLKLDNANVDQPPQEEAVKTTPPKTGLRLVK